MVVGLVYRTITSNLAIQELALHCTLINTYLCLTMFSQCNKDITTSFLSLFQGKEFK